jgi:hypothetical protein
VAGAAFVVAAAVVLSVSMGILLPQGGGLGPDVAIGWQARVLLVADVAWVVIAAGCTLAVRRAQRAADGEPALVDPAGVVR